MKIVLSWITTVVFGVVFLTTLIFFELFARIARLFGLRPLEYVMGVMQRILVAELLIVGSRVVVEGADELAPRTGYVILSNHQSMFDIPVFGGILFSNFPKYVAKKELGRKIPAVSFNLARGGNALIDRDDPRQALRAIRDLGIACQQRGTAVVLFPEGTRARDGELQEFHTSGATTLMKAAPDLPVVSCAVDGLWIVVRDGLKPIPFGTPIRVRFGKPVPRDPGEDRMEVLDRARNEIDATLRSWRKLP